MKYFKSILAVVALSFVGSTLAVAGGKKDKQKNVYVFGVAASFNDSIVYFTDIQPLDSVQLDKKTDFLPDRSTYAYQLKNYVESRLSKNEYTCMIYFSESKAKLQKEVGKVKGKYKQDMVKTIEGSSFKFEKP